MVYFRQDSVQHRVRLTIKETKSWTDMMNVNFFEWLRDGVRQSVLLGFSDAMEQIGSPPESEQISEKMAAVIGESKKGKTKQSTRSNTRKRLGKSLKELEETN